MRQKRAKAYRKLMQLYETSFGFRQPYQVLVDAELCRVSVAHKFDLPKQLPVVLQGEVKPMITQCCIHELYLQGAQQQAAVDLAKTFERRKCNHRTAIPGDECLSSVVGETNKHRYIVATQSQPLRVQLRKIPATPLVHVNRSVMVLEPPSDATARAKVLNEEQRLHASAPELTQVASTDPPKPKLSMHRGPRGPNPLSVKKKKTVEIMSRKRKAEDENAEDAQGPTDQPTRKRKRRKQVHKDKDSTDVT